MIVVMMTMMDKTMLRYDNAMSGRCTNITELQEEALLQTHTHVELKLWQEEK